MLQKGMIFSLCLSTIILLISGCSQTPRPVSYQLSAQHKMQAAKHWQILAKDVAKDIAEMMEVEGATVSPVSFAMADASPFSKAFQSFMATELVDSGVPLTMHSNDKSLELQWSVQTVTHRTKRSHNEIPPGTATVIGALGYGVFKVFKDSTNFAKAVTTGAVIDVGTGLYEALSPRSTQSEVIINVNIYKNNKIYYRVSNVYYVNDLDTDHYYDSSDLIHANRNIPTKSFEVINQY